jgi:hypothetical protein
VSNVEVNKTVRLDTGDSCVEVQFDSSDDTFGITVDDDKMLFWFSREDFREFVTTLKTEFDL